MKPVIGILIPRKENKTIAIQENYIHAVEQAGGTVLLLGITPYVDKETIAHWLSVCDGFLLPGGGDIAPSFYAQNPMEELGEGDRLRDDVELYFCKMVAQTKMPLLGICRGIQTINVAFGGSLWQDIPTQCGGSIGHMQQSKAWPDVHHNIILSEKSMLLYTMGGVHQQCNSFHHQAVHRVAAGLVVAAIAPDGIVEAIENKTGTILGVQWHPEQLLTQRPHAAIFTWLVQSAKQT